MLTQERLKELFEYKDGELYWRVGRQGVQRSKQLLAGCIPNTKRRNKIIRVDYRLYLAHRLIWLYHYGTMPSGEIDHIDHNPLNNRIENLRDVTHKENGRNQSLSRNNRSGHNGVYVDKKNGRWIASICLDGRNVHLGSFATITEAVEARSRADREQGFHRNHGAKATC
jgi:hypothetical protein